MPTLSNPRHEQFAALVAGGMTPTKAYVAAGFAGKGAAQSASRLAKIPVAAARIAELSTISSTVIARCDRP
jgi:phage terminase small subunit